MSVWWKSPGCCFLHFVMIAQNELFGLSVITVFLAFGSPSSAAVFTSLTQMRSINIGAGVSVTSNDDSGFSEYAGDGDGKSAAGFAGMDEAVGLSCFSFSTPYGGGGGSGRASQESSFSPSRIYFKGFADVYVTAGSGGDGYATASGSASSDLYYTFSLDSVALVQLDMTSAGVNEYSSEFTFSLAKSDGTVIWDQIGMEVFPSWLTTFSVDLPLDAGEYALIAHVGASSSYEGDFGFSGQATAEFSLSVIPEPSGGALLGAAALGYASRRRRRVTG